MFDQEIFVQKLIRLDTVLFPEISIVIPVFNNGEYLESCLESVLSQSFSSVEVICINDASTDNSKDILSCLNKREKRLVVIDNPQNLGPAYSRNKGISISSGRFIRFLDADDLLPANSLGKMYFAAMENSADLVRGSLALFANDNYRDLQTVIEMPNIAKTNLRTEQKLWIPWWHTSYLISRKLINENHLSYPDLVRGEDPVFMASVLVKANIISLVEDIVYLYRKYPKDRGSGGSTFQHVMDYFCHAKMIKEIYFDYHADCWSNGYSKFLLNDIRKLLQRCNLNHSELEQVNSELKYIWGKEVHIEATN